MDPAQRFPELGDIVHRSLSLVSLSQRGFALPADLDIDHDDRVALVDEYVWLEQGTIGMSYMRFFLDGPVLFLAVCCDLLGYLVVPTYARPMGCWRVSQYVAQLLLAAAGSTALLLWWVEGMATAGKLPDRACMALT